MHISALTFALAFMGFGVGLVMGIAMNVKGFTPFGMARYTIALAFLMGLGIQPFTHDLSASLAFAGMLAIFVAIGGIVSRNERPHKVPGKATVLGPARPWHSMPDQARENLREPGNLGDPSVYNEDAEVVPLRFAPTRRMSG
jgi:membrane-bound ClpP family serine protease